MRLSGPALLAVVACAASAHAAGDVPCGDDNLLAGKAPRSWRDVYRANLITDGVVARDGDTESGDLSAILGGPSAVLEYDLGGDRHVSAALLQAAAAGHFVVEMSEDRQVWTGLMRVEPSSQAGLFTRMAKHLDGHGSYLRLTVAGEGPWAISELQIFCRAPVVPPVSVQAAAPVSASVDEARRHTRHTLVLLLPVGIAVCLLFAAPGSRRRAEWAFGFSAIAFVIALGCAAINLSLGTAAACGVAVMALAAAVAFRGSASAARSSLRTGAAVLLIGIAAMAYANYGRFGGYWSVHYHDALHYVLGAKYAPELRYDGIYACLLDANAAERRWSHLAPSAVRDLRDDKVWPAAETAARAGCKGRFTPERWLAFRRDAAFFMGQLSPSAWAAVFTDHGYNATPVWTWLWRPIIGHVPLSTRTLAAMAHVDELAYVLMVLVLIWCWGIERAALAAVLFGFGFPWIYLWTGGSIGRSLWLVALAGAVGASARRRFVVAGVALGLASALQLFPVLVLAGPLVLAGRRAGELRGQARTVLLAALLTGIVLMLCSLQVAGPSLWLDFVRNTLRQATSTSANRIGAAVVSTHLGRARLLDFVLPIVALALWLRAALRSQDVVRLLALSVLVPIFALRLSSYYLVLVIALVPILDSWRRVLMAWAALLLVPQAIAWLWQGEPGPDAYALMSVSIVGAGIALCLLEAHIGDRELGRSDAGAAS